MTRSQKQFLFAYALLLSLCVVLLGASQFMSPVVRGDVLPIAADGFKTVLGATIGALSAMIGGEG